jgi:hypothetical protein
MRILLAQYGEGIALCLSGGGYRAMLFRGSALAVERAWISSQVSVSLVCLVGPGRCSWAALKSIILMLKVSVKIL